MKSPQMTALRHLSRKFTRAGIQRPDDVIAMQSVLCILLALLLIAANYFYPDTAEELYGKITALTSDPKNLIPNPIDLIISYLDKL